MEIFLMPPKTLALTVSFALALSGTAFAQTTAPGTAEKNLNNPGSVKSASEKGMPESGAAGTTSTVAPTAPMSTGTGAGATSTEQNLNNPGSVKSNSEKSGR
jgi:hypothetical protein